MSKGSSITFVALLASLGACAGAQEGGVCAEPATCGTGRVCVVGRCRPTDAPPSPLDTMRVLLAPVDLAVVASSGGAEPGAENFSLGRSESGTVVVLLRFESTWRDDADVTSAFVVLDTLEGVVQGTSKFTVEVGRVLDPWESRSVSWGRQPRLGPLEMALVTRPRARVPLRVDVTAIVRSWSKRSKDEQGIALVTNGSDPVGATYSLGLSGGLAPRLEAYVR